MNWIDLPEVALIRTLDYLPVRDQLNARLVCKHWQQIIDSSVRRDELALFYEGYPTPIYWFYNGSEVDPGNAFLLRDLDTLKNEFFVRYFRRVRRLVIAVKANTLTKWFLEAFQVSFLELNHLQFNFLGNKFHFTNFRKLVYQTNFHLPNLQTFYSEAGDMPLALHCPRLTELFVYSELTIDETTDEQTKLCVQSLRLLLVQKLTYPQNFEFSNLEVFYFNFPGPSISLGDFPRLKEIHSFFGVSGAHRDIQDALEDLLEQKRRLKRDQLKIYFDGLELRDPTDFEIFENYFNLPNFVYDYPPYVLHLHEKVLQLIKEGSSRFKFNLLRKRVLMNDQMDDELVGLPEGELVESMFKSASEICFEESLTKHSLNLFELSSRFRFVTFVHVKVEQSQALLDRLPDALPHLVHFSYYPKFFRNHHLNFEFISRFKSLHNFFVYRDLISIDELRLIMNNCKLIDSVDFDRPNGSRVHMNRYECGFKSTYNEVFQTSWYSIDRVEFARTEFSKEELLDYLEASRWLKKNNFLGEREEEKPALLLLRPIDANERQRAE